MLHSWNALAFKDEGKVQGRLSTCTHLYERALALSSQSITSITLSWFHMMLTHEAKLSI